MATKAMNFANDQQTGEQQSRSEKEENNCDDDRNNNAQDKVIPKLSILKINESFSKIEKVEKRDSAKALPLGEESSMSSDRKDNGLKFPTSKSLTLLNDRKTDELKPSFSLLHHSRNYGTSSRGSAVLPLLTSEPVKEETGNDFTDYFPLPMAGSDGGKSLATSPGTSKPESEIAKSTLSEHLAAMSSKTVTSSSATDLFASSGQLPAMLDTENISKNRPKSANTGAASQAGPVKPRCTPAREAVDPAKYFTLTDEPDGTKYACSKCGNVYKWRKSLNKHWKEKHDGEIPNLHARPPPSLLQRERFLNPLRGPQKHSVFHQPGFHGSGSKSTTAPVISPPRLNSIHAGKNHPQQGMSPYLFGKFPMKDDGGGSEAGKGIVHQTEEPPATAVVRPSRSNHSPVAPHRWTNWLSSTTTSRPILDLPSKLKIPMIESIKSAHDHAQSRDTFGQMFPAIQGGHQTLRGGPLDLSATLISRSSNDDDNILDLSRKSSSDVMSSSKVCATAVQDEPLDFSTKSHGKHLGCPKHVSTAPPDSSFSANWFPVGEKKDSILPKAMDYSDIGLEGGKGSLFAVSDYDKPGQVFCARCQLPCKTVDDLNHHFARNHASALYEVSADVRGIGSASSANQLLKHLAWENAKKTMACVVCGMSVQWSWMLARHFEQVHASIQPNPYKKTSSAAAAAAAAAAVSATGTSYLDSGAKPAPVGPPTAHRCETCPFVTDSVAEFSRHQLKHSLVKEKKNKQESRNRSGYLQISDDDQSKDPAVSKCPSSGVPFNQFADEIIDLEGENTAIVIPQAPEETYLEGGRYQNEASGSGDSTSAYAKLPFESGIVTSGENSSTAIPPAPEDASDLSSSALCSTPSGSKVSRSKKDAGLTTESLLPFKCELCEYRARWPSEMMQHMKNHSDEKPYQCPQCSYRSKWKWDVVKHLKRCGGGGSVKDVIDTTLRRKSFVKSLLIDSHSLQSAYDEVHSYGSMSYPGYYDQSNPSKLHDALLLKGPPNVTVYSGMNGSNGSPEEEVDGYDNCDDSEDTTSEDMSLSRSDQGNEAGQNGHGCSQCPFVGHSPAELRRHLRVHSDEKPYSCQTCTYSSKWKCDLKKHLKAYDHVSGVPLNYGGHGKKPVEWSQVVREMSCSAAEFEESDLKLLLQGRCHGKRDPGLDRHLSRDSGNLFGGITSGGRLRCKQCEFEAIDITSFLQHKKMHRGDEVRRRDGIAVKRKSPLPSHHHRRKSFKQTRVIPTETGGREISEKAGRGGGNVKIADVADPEEEHSAETNRFWKSLGLQSISSSKHKRQSSTGESDDTCDDPDSSDPETELRYGSSSRCADLSRGGDFGKQSSQASSNSYESNSDVEIDPHEANEYGNYPGRAKGETELEGVEEADRFSAGNHLKETKASQIKSPFQMAVRRGLRQGVTTTEAEDAAGMSKRKRKLRTCEKCGYITDNLTTLQRHAAKHGSGGRHRCWMCDYSVDRQHVLEYHVKIVHKGADRAAETKLEEPSCGTKAETPNDKMSAENFLEKSSSIDRNSAFERGSFGGKRKIVCTTSVITVRGHEMEMIQKGNKTWYNCIKCHFVSSNITNAVNHAKQHGANKRYRCRHCDYSLDRRSSIANHMYSQHSQPNAFQFQIGGTEKDRLKPEEFRRGRIQRPRYSLLDQMGSHWKKLTCIRCGFSSINPGRMTLHRLTHGRLDKEHGCKTCGYRATSCRLLVRHVTTSHGLTESTDGSRGIDLSVARSEGDVSAPRTSGLETSNDSGKGKVTGRAGDISARNEKIRKPKKIRCPFCPFATLSVPRSVVHAKHHNSLKRLPCGECSFRADVRNVLFHHKKLHR